jgi:hypothetical protein
MRERRRIGGQRGSTGGTGLPILLIGLFVFWGVHAAGLPLYVAALAAVPLLWLARLTGAMPFADAWLRSRRAARLAADLDGVVERQEHGIWGGGTAIAYGVRWQHYSLWLDVTGVQFTASAAHEMRAAGFDTFKGALKLEGDGEALLDAPTRDAVRAIDAIAGRSHLSFDARGKVARLYKHRELTRRQALRLVRLGTPVLERALARLKA